jgi:hypothetical protein
MYFQSVCYSSLESENLQFYLTLSLVKKWSSVPGRGKFDTGYTRISYEKMVLTFMRTYISAYAVAKDTKKGRCFVSFRE